MTDKKPARVADDTVVKIADGDGYVSDSLGKSFNLTPTDEGFSNIAKTFVASLVGDVKASRRKDAASILDSLLETVIYLDKKDPALALSVRDFVKEYTK